MPGRTPREAVHAYKEPLQKALSQICSGVLQCSNQDRLNEISSLFLSDPIQMNGTKLCVDVKQLYQIIKDPQNGPFRVTTAYYKYAVETDQAEEILGYHWHPDGPSPIKYAHLHLGPGAQVGRTELNGRAHFPTGRVAFEDFIKLVIEIFDAKPQKESWRDILASTKEKFERHKKW